MFENGVNNRLFVVPISQTFREHCFSLDTTEDVSFFAFLANAAEQQLLMEAVCSAAFLRPKIVKENHVIDIKQYGYTEPDPITAGLLPGRIIELRRERYTVICEQGEVPAVLKGAFCYNAEAREDYPCVGDFVALQYNDCGNSIIVQLLPRRTKFSRADFSGHKAGYVKTILEQVVAANFDYVFIVSSLNNDFNARRIERYLIQTRQSSSQPVIILTKADLLNDWHPQLSAVKEAAPDVPVYAISSHSGLGMPALGPYLQPGKTIVFLGMSGVGKSSLLNVLMGREVMEVKAIREDDSRGRHTTSHRQLFMLPSGAMVIDTPGMRELGLIGSDGGIGTGYPDIEELFEYCRFSDCRHQSEPGCAVRSAISEGSLSCEQWDNYQAQKREMRFSDDKSAYLRDKGKFAKSISKFSKQHYKTPGGKK